jgi:hypothetical protein
MAKEEKRVSTLLTWMRLRYFLYLGVAVLVVYLEVTVGRSPNGMNLSSPPVVLNQSPE